MDLGDNSTLPEIVTIFHVYGFITGREVYHDTHSDTVQKTGDTHSDTQKPWGWVKLVPIKYIKLIKLIKLIN